MKHLNILLIFIFLLLGCTDSSNHNHIKQKKLLVIAYDISLTTDGFSELEIDHIMEAYDLIAKTGGGKIILLYIMSNSYKQNEISLTINSLDTVGSIVGNVFEKEKSQQDNSDLMSLFLSVKEENFSSLQLKLRERTEPFTDLDGALSRVKLISEQPNYEEYSKNIMLITDGINDQPPVHGEDEIKVITMIDDLNVAVINPVVNLENFIKGPKIEVFTSITDAINYQLKN